MIDSIKKFEKMSIATSILLIIFSLFLIFKPEASLSFMVIIIGAVLLLTGIIHMISYFTSSREFKTISTELIEGTIYSVVGLFLILKTSVISEFLAIIIGSWLIIQFIIKFQFAFNLKSAASPSWSLMLLSSIFHLLFGLLMLLNPFESMVTITTISGIILLISEAVNLAESILFMIKNS